MKENWKELIGKRILLKKKYLTTAYITEATVVEISESGKFVKFKWRHGGESWEVPDDEYSFSYDKVLEVLGQASKEIEAEEKSEKEKAYPQNMLGRAQVAADKEKKEQIGPELVLVRLYKDERNNWRYNCDKLKVSGGFCPRELAVELDEKYGSKTRIDKALPAWLVSKLKMMKDQRIAISPKNDDFISGRNATIREIEAASGGYLPRVVVRPIEGKEPETQTIHITFPVPESEQESEIYNGGIYEILKPNECCLITKIDNRLLVANNKDGKIEVEYVSLAHEEDAMAAIHAIGAGRAIGAGINTLLKMLSEQEEKKPYTTVKKGE